MMIDWYIDTIKQQCLRRIDFCAKDDRPAVIKVDAMVILDLILMLEDIRKQVRKDNEH